MTEATEIEVKGRMMQDYQGSFLRELLPAVLAFQRRTGLPASVVAAQAILESDWGRSLLARRNRNLFGIKAHARGASVAVYATTEYVGGQARQEKARFACYESFDACLEDFAQLLARPRYAPARAVRGNPAAYARELQRCGYASDPRYAHKLSLLIRSYQLEQYDLAPEAASPSERAQVAPELETT